MDARPLAQPAVSKHQREQWHDNNEDKFQNDNTNPCNHNSLHDK